MCIFINFFYVLERVEGMVIDSTHYYYPTITILFIIHAYACNMSGYVLYVEYSQSILVTHLPLYINYATPIIYGLYMRLQKRIDREHATEFR